VEDVVFFRVTSSRRSLKHPKGGKLSPRYVGPFLILERVGAVVYHLELSDGLIGIRNVFHVSQLKKYNPDPKHVLNKEPLPNLSNFEKPKKILERSAKELRNKSIPMVKVL
jgi:hypothetical protein